MVVTDNTLSEVSDIIITNIITIITVGKKSVDKGFIHTKIIVSSL